MSDKKIFKIYKILNESINEVEKNPIELINLLIWKVNRDIKSKKWKTTFNKPKKSINYTRVIEWKTLEIILYKAKHSFDDMFGNFFDSNLLWWEKFNKVEDIFICFVIIENNIYFFSSSHTFAYFLSFVDEDFSINIASKLITWNIKNEKSINIMWDTLTSDLIFRWLKSFSKFDNLWKVIKWFIWELNNIKIKKIIKGVFTKKYFCEVWNSFTFRMSLEFKWIIELIHNLNILNCEWEKSDDYKDFQMLEKINTRLKQNQIKKKLLDIVVSKIIFEYYKRPLSNNLDNFELVHPNKFIEFIECSKFELRYKWKEKIIEWVLHLKEIINFIKGVNDKISSEKDLLKILENNIYLAWENPDWEIKIELWYKNLFSYIITEFTSNNNKYFLINGDYYFVKEDFIKILDKDLIEELTEEKLYLDKWIDKNILPWTSWSEWDYNKKYLKEKDFLVLDKILYKWIEFCDLLYSWVGSSYLFHNKKWFEWDMRILSEQVLISAITLSEHRKLWNKNVFKDYYKSLINKKGSYSSWPSKWKLKAMNDIWSQKVSETEFLSYFENKKDLKFVLAFTYWEDLISIFKKWNEKDFEKLSLIAKYELLTLIKKMRTIWIPFYITQIKTK